MCLFSVVCSFCILFFIGFFSVCVCVFFFFLFFCFFIKTFICSHYSPNNVDMIKLFQQGYLSYSCTWNTLRVSVKRNKKTLSSFLLSTCLNITICITRLLDTFHLQEILVFVCVEVLRPSQPDRVMSSADSLPNHTFTGQA